MGRIVTPDSVAWGRRKPDVGSILDPGDPINAGLVAAFLMNESGGLTVADLVTRNAGAVGSALTWMAGPFGPAINSIGGGAAASITSIKVPRTAWLDINGSYSISAWVKTTGAVSNSAIGGKWTGSTGYMLFVFSNNLRVYANANFTATTSNKFAAAIDWTHVVGVLNVVTGRIQVYYNGALDTDAAIAGTTVSAAAVPYEIGNYANSGGNPWDTGLASGGGIDNQRLYRRPLTPSEVMRLYTEPFAGVVVPKRRLYLAQPASGYTLTAAVGSFTETGQAAALKVGHALPAGSGSFSEAGQAAALKVGHALPAGTGIFAETAQAAGLIVAHRLVADAGSASASGQNAALTVGHVMPAGDAAFALSGQDATLVGPPRALTLTAEPGALTLAGQEVGLAVQRVTTVAGSAPRGAVFQRQRMRLEIDVTGAGGLAAGGAGEVAFEPAPVEDTAREGLVELPALAGSADVLFDNQIRTEARRAARLAVQRAGLLGLYGTKKLSTFP